MCLKNLMPDGTLCSLQYVVMTTVCVMFSSLWYLSCGCLSKSSTPWYILGLYYPPVQLTIQIRLCSLDNIRFSAIIVENETEKAHIIKDKIILLLHWSIFRFYIWRLWKAHLLCFAITSLTCFTPPSRGQKETLQNCQSVPNNLSCNNTFLICAVSKTRLSRYNVLDDILSVAMNAENHFNKMSCDITTTSTHN